MVYDGMTRATGMDSGRSPESIDQDQVSYAVNVTFRGDFPTNRPPFVQLEKAFDSTITENHWDIGRFQGAAFYDGSPGPSSIIIARGGRLFRWAFGTNSNDVSEITIKVPLETTAIVTVPAPAASVDIPANTVIPLHVGDVLTIDSGTYTITALFEDLIRATYGGGAGGATIAAGTPILNAGVQVQWEDTNADDDFAFLFQAEKFMLLGQGQHLPIIYNGSKTRRANDFEIPPFYCGAYVMGRIWFAFPNRNSYGATNLVGSVGNTPDLMEEAVLIYKGPDAENTYLNEGGEFFIPGNAGPITAINTTFTIDTSLGQGPVSIFTTNGVFTCNAPVDRTVWKDITYPIQTVAMLDYGALAARGVINVNSDCWYRSQDGIRSFIIARRNFGGGWGNTPMSHEVGRILDNDDKSLLEYGSAVLFDNRFLATCSPKRTERGVAHCGLVVLNFDDITTIRTKTTPAWEGLWDGIAVFQIVRGRVNGLERCFAICDVNQKMQVVEIMLDGSFDYSISTNSKGETSVVTKAISSWIEMRSLNFNSPLESKVLRTADLFVDDVRGSVTFDVKYRPDQLGCWIKWHEWTECTTVDHCEQTCPDATNYKPGYRPYMMLPTPPDVCIPGLKRVANRGYQFQPGIMWTGKARIKSFRLQALRQLDDSAGECL